MKINIKDVFYEASLEELQYFLEKVQTNENVECDANKITQMVYKKTGVKDEDLKPRTSSKLSQKGEKTQIKRFIYAVACVILAVAVVLGMRHFNFGNPPVTNSEDESGEIVSKDNSTVSENVSETVTEDNSNDSSVVTPENFEIKGINWAEDSLNNGREDALHLVKDLLWNGDRLQCVWAKVVLNKLTPLGVYEKDNKSLLYQSIAEIKIIDVYDFGNLSDSVNEGDTLQIIVDWIVEDGKVFISNYLETEKGEKETFTLPMTEIGKEYVFAFGKIQNKEVLSILEENHPEIDISLGSFTSYPMFSVDFSEIDGLNEYKIDATWAFMYVTIYEWYMENKVSPDSNETKLYELFDVGINVPENPQKSQ